MEAALQSHLGLPMPIRRSRCRSSLHHDIHVFVDFEWSSKVGHAHATFPNYKILGDYLRSQRLDNSQIVLILTTSDCREGRRQSFDGFDVFVVNIDRYMAVAKNDAAAAYFAGLSGVPMVDAIHLPPGALASTELETILDRHATTEAVLKWLNADPGRRADTLSGLAPRRPDSMDTTKLTQELERRLARIDADGVEGLRNLIDDPDFPAGVLRAANLQRRAQAVLQFRKQLDDDGWSEGQWQSFFQREDWIFGHGLLYHFLEPIQREATVAPSDMSGRRAKIVDFLKKTAGIGASFAALIEIKKPRANLMLDRPLRDDVYGIAKDLAEAVSQINVYCDDWATIGQNLGRNATRAKQEGWGTASPRGIIVIGDTRQLKQDGMKDCFELFRRRLHGVEVVAYDELLVRADNLANG